MPNAIEPNVAQTNIAKFNRSAIALAFVGCPEIPVVPVSAPRPLACPPLQHRKLLCDSRRKMIEIPFYGVADNDTP